MYELTADNVAEYLRSAGRVGAVQQVAARELAGGVSNLVLLVSLPDGGERFVMKQARGRLRVAEEWLCSVERIWREVEVLKLCGELLRIEFKVQGSRFKVEAEVPQLLWEDRANYAYAMTAAPDEHRTWKQMLLAGEIGASRDLAVACGQLLGAIHGGSWRNEDIARQLDDRSYFEQLRIDPYYRWIALKHSDLAGQIGQLVESVATHRRCLVHGDFSPKNLLVWPGHVMQIDFEVGHYGDPAFDLGFFLTHLLLKSLWAGERGDEYRQIADLFWRTYRAAMLRSVAAQELAALEQRTLLNLAGCMLARVDGKSPVDYLELRQQEIVRDLARSWLLTPPPWDAAIAGFK
ncbi:MAG TPA: aminoglycoside phosphotransferase family protein [Pirellulaceae bacterium]|jgi:5-methylthioribose kinase